MLDGILNNRKEWNAKKEEYEAKLKAIEDEKAAKAAAAASKGALALWAGGGVHRDGGSQVNLGVVLQLLPTTPAAAPRPAPCAEGPTAASPPRSAPTHLGEGEEEEKPDREEALRRTFWSHNVFIYSDQSGVQSTFL